jgi:hypothetical protein
MTEEVQRAKVVAEIAFCVHPALGPCLSLRVEPHSAGYALIHDLEVPGGLPVVEDAPLEAWFAPPASLRRVERFLERRGAHALLGGPADFEWRRAEKVPFGTREMLYHEGRLSEAACDEAERLFFVLRRLGLGPEGVELVREMLRRRREGGAAVGSRPLPGIPTVLGEPGGPWETLGVPSTASRRQALAAYRKMALKLHPDRPGGSDEAMRRLSSAWETIRALRGW